MHGQLGHRARGCTQHELSIIIIYLCATSMALRRSDDDFNRAVRKRNARGMIFKEEERKEGRDTTSTRARALVKIARIAFLLAVYASRSYIRRFSKFTTSARLFLFRLIKFSL